MVAHSTMRIYGVKKAFRFVEGIWLHRKGRQARKKIGKDLLYIIRTQHVLSYQFIQENILCGRRVIATGEISRRRWEEIKNAAVREAAKKVFFSGPATRALPPSVRA